MMDNNNNFKCINGNPATSTCATASCSAGDSLLCNQQHCRCHKQHPGCLDLTLEKLQRVISFRFNKVKSSYQQEFAPLQKTIDSLVSEIVALKDSFQSTFFLKMYLTQQQLALEKALRTGKWQITPKNIASVISKGEDVTQIQPKSLVEIEGFVKEAALRFNKLKQFVQNFKRTHKEKQGKNQSQSHIVQKVLNLPLHPLPGSRVADHKQSITIIKFFRSSGLEPQNFKLLYRASEYEYKLSAFHHLCNSVSHTLTIVRTEYHRVFGGYSSLSWGGNGFKKIPNTHSPFIFSVDGNTKLDLLPEHYAVYCNSKHGPTFGEGHDIYICENARESGNSRAGIVNSYGDGKLRNQQSTWTMFSGQMHGYQFRVIDWEVWQVQLPEESPALLSPRKSTTVTSPLKSSRKTAAY